MTVRITRPIMIVCAGRSGSTMLYRILARHEDLGWLSTYNQMFPSQVWLSFFSRFYALGFSERIRDAKAFPKPFSPYKFWGRYLPEITRHDRPLYPQDIPQESIGPLRRAVGKALAYQGKDRLLMKVTGWARMAYFNRIFPDALFVYLKRKPIAVVGSWLNAGWLNVSGELDTEDWEWGEVPHAYRRLWNELGGGPALSAAVKTQLDMDDIRRNVDQFPGRCFELNYEDLVVRPRKTFREILDFCRLSWNDHFDEVLRSTKILDYRDRWKEHLSPEDAQRVQTFFDSVEAEALPSACR